MSNANEWPMVRLGEVAKFIRGVTFKPADKVNSEDGIPIMRTKNVQASLEFSDVIRIPASLVKEDRYLRVGDTLVSTANSWNLVGKCCWVPELTEPTAIGGFVSALRATSEQILPRYLYYWFNSYKIQATVRSFSNQTTNIANLAIKRCLDLKIPLPPLPEQQRIAEILDSSTSNSASRKKQLEQLSELKNSIFDRFHLAHLKQATQYRLQDVVPRIESGKSPVCESRPATTEEWGVLKLSAVTTGEFLQSENKAYLGDPQPLTSLEVQHGDLLMTRKNTPDLVGAVSLVRETRPNLLLPDLIFRLNVDEELAEPEYLAALLMSPPVRFSVRSLAGGSAKSMSNISKQRLNKLPLDLPPLEIQRKFVSLYKGIYRAKDQILAAQKLDQELHHSLSTRAFAGQL